MGIYLRLFLHLCTSVDIRRIPLPLLRIHLTYKCSLIHIT